MNKLIFSIAVFFTSVFAASAQDWANFGRYEKANAEVTARPKAVFMGDSLTDGWASTDNAFFADNNFIGRGISGQTTSHMLVRFRRDVVDHAPEYVVILAGTNDIAKNNGDISHENTLGNIISMCEIARYNDIIPIICSVLPADSFWWRPGIAPAKDIVSLNKLLKEYADRENIIYVDYYSAMADENGAMVATYADDGVHPNMNGYKVMESIVLEVLK